MGMLFTALEKKIMTSQTKKSIVKVRETDTVMEEGD